MLGFGKAKPEANTNQRLTGDLADEKRRFEVIINSIADGVILIDDQQTIQLLNPSAAVVTGWPVDEATGINVQTVVKLVNEKGKPIDASDNPFQRIFQLDQPLRENNAFLINREGKQIPLSLNLSPLMDANKRVTAAVAVFRDVAEERAQEKQRADFISTASHEMRTPVAAIEGYLALALNDKVATIDNRARDYLEKAHISTKHLGQLFQDLLTSAKAEDGRLTSHPTVVDMGKFLEQLVNDLRFSADKKGLLLEYKLGSSSSTINATQSTKGERVVSPIYSVYIDPDRVREAITNLFDNAVKYTPEGKITVGLTGDEHVVQCYISDTGPGIPAEDVPHLFQKFYRIDNSATRTIGGTGLGLFITRKIIELYSGRIWVESELGKGSSFYINLPRLSAQKAAELQASSTESTELAPINSLASP